MKKLEDFHPDFHRIKVVLIDGTEFETTRPTAGGGHPHPRHRSRTHPAGRRRPPSGRSRRTPVTLQEEVRGDVLRRVRRRWSPVRRALSLRLLSAYVAATMQHEARDRHITPGDARRRDLAKASSSAAPGRDGTVGGKRLAATTWMARSSWTMDRPARSWSRSGRAALRAARRTLDVDDPPGTAASPARVFCAPPWR